MTEQPLKLQKALNDQELDVIRQKQARRTHPAVRIYVVFSFLVIVFLIQVFILWQMFSPVVPITYALARVPVITKEVHSGQRLVYHIEYCKNVDAPALATFEMKGPIDFFAPSIVANVPVGCGKTDSSIFVIPLSTPPGVYTLTVRSQYQINSFKSVTAEFSTEQFTVLP